MFSYFLSFIWKYLLYVGLTSIPSYILKGYGYPRLVTMTVFGCRASEDRLELR